LTFVKNEIMNKLLSFFIAAVILSSCSGSATDNKESVTPKTEKATKDSIPSDTVAVLPEFDSGLKTSFTKFSAKKCFTEDPEEFQMTENGEYCAERKVKLLVAQTTDVKTGEAINKELFRLITDQKSGNSGMQAFVNKIKSISEIYEAAFEEWECSIISQTNKIFSVGIRYEYMGYGAAHGMRGYQSVNFNLENGSVLKLADVLSAGYEKELKKIAEKRFIAENGKEGWEFKPGKGNFPLAQNYAFTKKGIVFSYNEYEIGSYAMTMPEMTVSYDLISQLIPETSPLRTYMNVDKLK
jgi:hypothetical protein